MVARVSRARPEQAVPSLCDGGLVFDHVTIRVSDRPRSERFYETVLAVLGKERTHTGDLFVEWGDLSIAEASEEGPVTR